MGCTGQRVVDSGEWVELLGYPLPDARYGRDGAGLHAQIAQGSFLVGKDLRVLSQTHDLERLLDDRGQSAEPDTPALVDHLLDDFDQDADADRVDDLGLPKIEQQIGYPAIHQLVGPRGDLFPTDIIDVAAGVENCAVIAPLDRNFEFFGHHHVRLFSDFTMRMVVPAGPLEISTSSMCAFMIARPQPRFCGAPALPLRWAFTGSNPLPWSVIHTSIRGPSSVSAEPTNLR